MPTSQEIPPAFTYLQTLRQIISAPRTQTPLQAGSYTVARALLHSVQSSHAAITRLAIYVRDHDVYRLWLSLDDPAGFPPLLEFDAHAQQVIDNRESFFPASQSEPGYWLVPLWMEKDEFGVLHAVPAADASDHKAMQTALETLGALLSLAISYEQYRTLDQIEQTCLVADEPETLLAQIYAQLASQPDRLTFEAVQYDEQGSPAAFCQQAVHPSTEADPGSEVIDVKARQLEAYVELLEGGAPVLINDLKPDTALPSPVKAYFLDKQTRALGAFPVLFQGQLISVLTAGYREPHVFSVAEIRSLQRIGQQIGLTAHHRQVAERSCQRTTTIASQDRLWAALHETSQHISTNLAGLDMLQTTCDQLRQALDMGYAAILRFDQVPGMANVLAESPSFLETSTLIDLEKFTVYHSLKEGQPILIGDVSTEENLQGVDQILAKAPGLRTILFVPLLSRNDLIGTLVVATLDSPCQVTQTILAGVQIIAAQIALSLHNIELFIEIQRRANQLGQIAAFGRLVSSTFDREEILQRIRDVLPNLLPFSHASLIEYRGGQTYMNVIDLMNRENETQVLAAGSNVVEAIQTQTPLLLFDLKNTASAENQQLVEAGINTALITPLIAGKNALGALRIGHKTFWAYSRTDLTLFQQIGSHVAIALQNAQVFQQARQRALYEEALSEITSKFQRQTDLHDLLHQTAHDLGRMLGARRARIRLHTSSGPDGFQGSAYTEE